VKEHVTELKQDVSTQLRKVLDQRELRIVFQPIFGFREGAILGYEALVRGPEGSLVQMPLELFGAAAEHGLVVELNKVCIQEVLRTFAGKDLPGNLFLNVSPQLVLQPGFSQDRSRRFMKDIGLDPARVVIELTEDYPTFDFRRVRESLALYRSMGFRVAIDDLGEGFASLRLWSELKPEFVKADKHFVAGIARDPVKVQFLRAIQHIAENCGSLVIAEGIESADDFRVVKDVGVACGQGWFVGHPAESPALELAPEVARANADRRLPVVPAPRFRAGSELTARDFLRSVEAVTPQATLGAILDRFAHSPGLNAIPVIGTSGVQALASRCALEPLAAALPDVQALRSYPALAFCDPVPIRAEADLGLDALTAILVESDARRMADGFVIVARGRYLGMGASQDVMRMLHKSQVLAARYTSPLTMLPGQVPINELLERLLAGRAAFTAWYAEIDQMRGLNDSVGFAQGDALIHETARLLESVAEAGIDFVGHVAGGRFVLLVQSEDWQQRAERAIAGFAPLVEALVPRDILQRGYFLARNRDGREILHPLPKLALGILPVLPGVFEFRHEVLATAKQAAHEARKLPGSACHVDLYHGHAYPHSMLFEES
jgi:EAL domain-containing protein (putative c-di-GMP-specific phosphodiesterase class I)/GGDEF domain-containing protein